MVDQQLKVLYEDNHIIVVEKPSGIPTQEDSTGDIDMYSLVKEYIRVKYNKPGNVFVGIVHRLDRPVGGVMVFARTSKGASRLSEQIRNRNFRKVYLAMLDGIPKKDEDRLENYLWKDEKKNQVYVVNEGKDGAKKAVLDYKVLRKIGNQALVEVELHTGRPHQIRVQFANIGCPLVGDGKYGKATGKSEVMLFSHLIGFQHPTTKEDMEFKLVPEWSAKKPENKK